MTWCAGLGSLGKTMPAPALSPAWVASPPLQWPDPRAYVGRP